jgi:hypothetical protein
LPDAGDRRPTTRRAFAAGAGVIAAVGAAAIAAAARAQPLPPQHDAGPGLTSETPTPPTNAAEPTPTAPPVTNAPPGPFTPPPAFNTQARSRDLGKLSNVLYNNPSERSLFLADPGAYAARLGLRNIAGADLSYLRGLVADGFCCMGCGC